jgi:TolA-binding protein
VLNLATSGETVGRPRWPVYLLLGLLILSVGIGGFQYFANVSLATQNSALKSQNLALSSKYNSTLNSLRVAEANISSLLSLKAKLQATISNLTSQVSSLSSQNSKLQASVNSLNSQIASLSSQIAGLNAQIATAQSQITNLQSSLSNLSSIISLSKSIQIANDIYVVETPGDLVPFVTTFVAHYAGFIVVSGYTNAANGTIEIDETLSSTGYSGQSYSFYSYSFSGHFSVILPILPGQVNVRFGSFDATYDSANVSVVYYF